MVSKPKKEKRGCEIVVESQKDPDANRRDKEKFKSHRYFANKVKGFWEEIKKCAGI